MDARSRQRYEKLRLIGGRDPYRRRLEGRHGPMASAVFIMIKKSQESMNLDSGLLLPSM